jgi:hypothetical protein
MEGALIAEEIVKRRIVPRVAHETICVHLQFEGVAPPLLHRRKKSPM